MIYLIIILAILGIFDTSYLTAKHYLDQAVYCPVGKSCETVLNSAYSTFYGIPIALFGALFYFAILIFALIFFQTNKKFFLKIIFTISAPALLFSIWLVYLQLFIIKAICFYCVLSAINVLIIFSVSLYMNLSKKMVMQAIR